MMLIKVFEAWCSKEVLESIKTIIASVSTPSTRFSQHSVAFVEYEDPEDGKTIILGSIITFLTGAQLYIDGKTPDEVAEEINKQIKEQEK